LVIELPHHAGALHDALEPFARRDIDLLKIEGRPVKGRPWEYCFYLDLRGSANDTEVTSALEELRERRVETRILGSYVSARVPAVKVEELL
jgi:prephenate dehydratase